MKYRICYVTLCKDEIDILPFVKQYWDRLEVSKVVVFDNGSNDGSIEFLEKIPYVEVRHFDSDGQNDIIQKSIKEHAYMEFKDQFDVIIISDMDELFYFKNFENELDKMFDGRYNAMVAPIFSLCEDFKPEYNENRYLHQLCHKFYKQRMNHMKNFDWVSKISIFNCKNTEAIAMSVGQHYVQTLPNMKIRVAADGICLHIDKGFGLDYKFNVRQKMNANLSDVNKRNGMCVEYADSYEKLKAEYEENQKNGIDINTII